MQRQVDLAVGGQVAQGGGVEAGVVGVEDTFGAAGQAFVDPAVAGLLVLQVGQRAAEVPFAAMGDRVGLAVHAVGLVAEHLLHVVVAVGVLRVAGVDVALAAEAGLELEGLLGRQAPAEQPVDVLVAHAFATGGEGAGLLAGAVGFVAGVDVPVVRVGLGDVAVDAVAEVFRERPVETEAHPFAGAFGLVLREIAVDAEITVGFRAGLLGDDVHHAARRAVAVARRRRAADHFDALDLVGRHPVGVAAAVALAAPAVAHRVARADRLAVDQDQGVLRAHAADVDLPVVATLAAGAVAGQVDPRHGPDDLRQVVARRSLGDVLGGDDGNPRRLLGFLLGGGDHGLLAQLDDGAVALAGGVYGVGEQATGQQQEGNGGKGA
ncbi:Uncharacterised protein [Acinetobacter baumannii]|nr:Uncharacterised protein [Acinetobacter baumannii]